MPDARSPHSRSSEDSIGTLQERVQAWLPRTVVGFPERPREALAEIVARARAAERERDELVEQNEYLRAGWQEVEQKLEDETQACIKLEEQLEAQGRHLAAVLDQKLVTEIAFSELKEQLRTAETTLAHAEAFIEHQDMSYRWAEWCEGRGTRGGPMNAPSELVVTIENGIGNDNWANACNDARGALRELVEQLETLRTDYALLRGTLMQIECMPVRIQLGNKLAENPAITHDLAAQALAKTQLSMGDGSSPASVRMMACPKCRGQGDVHGNLCHRCGATGDIPASEPDCEWGYYGDERNLCACPTCEGIGAQAGAHTERVEPCPTCEGTGRKKVEATG